MNGLRTRFYRKKLFKEPVLKFFLGISEKKDEFSLNLGNFLLLCSLNCALSARVSRFCTLYNRAKNLEKQIINYSTNKLNF